MESQKPQKYRLRDSERLLGAKGEFVLAPRLDDLQSAFALTKAFTESTPAEYINTNPT